MKTFLAKGLLNPISSQVTSMGMLGLFSKKAVRLPFKRNVKKEMARLSKALSGIPSNNKQALVMALYRQGYNSHLKLHKDHITLKKAKLGDHRDTGYHLTLTRGKKELSAMHFGNILIR